MSELATKQLHYSFSILRPLQEVIRTSGSDFLGFLKVMIAIEILCMLTKQKSKPLKT